MTRSEKRFFLERFQGPYFKHFQACPSSLLARIYGIYTVKMQGHAPVHLMMLAHTLKCDMGNIQRIYDLKGSTVKREVQIDM
jgi:hypothetical protein